MKILVIQTAFIGDVILATPVFREIVRCKPDATLDVLVRKGNESLLDNFPGIRSVITWDKKKGKYQTLVKLLRQIRAERYDYVFNLQRFGATGFLTAFSGAKNKIGFDKNPFSVFYSKKAEHIIGEDRYIHETSRNLELILDFGANNSARPILYPSPADDDAVVPYQKNEYICLAPTSVWYTKQLPCEKWLELIREIRQQGFRGDIFLLGGPDDRQVCEDLKIAGNDNAIRNLAGSLSFLQTAALMKSAKMNYVNDSAPLHIASAMNAPVTVFYCSTVPSFGFGPLSDNSHIIEHPQLSCRPCGLHGYRACPQQHFRCALELNMQQAAANLHHE